MNKDVGGNSSKGNTNAIIEDRIFELLARRGDGKTICPSEVARSLATGGEPWRELMPQIREAAQRLARANRILVTRKFVEVDATSQGGPIRLGLPPGDA